MRQVPEAYFAVVPLPWWEDGRNGLLIVGIGDYGDQSDEEQYGCYQ